MQDRLHALTTGRSERQPGCEDEAAGRPDQQANEPIMSVASTVLALHIASFAVWTGALLYLPTLFLRQELAQSAEARDRWMLMQRWLYSRVMTPAALLATVFGSWMVFARPAAGGWLHVKVTLVFLMALYHVYCGQLMVALKQRSKLHGRAYYRVLPVLPALLAGAVLWLVTGRPF